MGFGNDFRCQGARNIGKRHIPIFILMLLVNRAHERSRRRQDLIDEDEDRLLGGQLDALADNIYELADRQVGRHQVFFFVDGCNVAFFDLLADHRDTIGVLLSLFTESVLMLDDGDGMGIDGRLGYVRCVRPQPYASRRGARP